MTSKPAARPVTGEAAPIRRSLAPLAVPLDIELLGGLDGAALAPALRRWHGTPDAGAARLALRVEVDDELSGAGPCAMHIEGARLLLSRPGAAEGCADSALGEGWCRISADYLAQPALLDAEVFEPLVLFLLARSDRVPLHAAGFLAGDLVVLLAGPSGAGKSSLALAADAAGFRVLSEDTVHVQRRPRIRIWGWPGPVHLLPANTPGRHAFPIRLRGGTLKHAVPLSASGSGAALSGSTAVLCVLRRGERVSLDRLSTRQALRSLDRLEPGFDRLAREIGEVHAALAARGAWRLTLSADPAEAIALLAANLARLRETAVP